MKKGRVVDLKNFKILGILFSNKLSIVLGSVFVLGVIISSVCFDSIDTLSRLTEGYFEDYIVCRENSFIYIFFNSIKSLMLFLLLIYLCGSSILGFVLSPLLIFLRGFEYGSLISYVYSLHSLKGIAFNAVLIIPPAIISVLTFISAARFSMEFSLLIAKLTLPRANARVLSEDFKNYSARFLLLILFLVLASIVDSGLSKFLIDTFNF